MNKKADNRNIIEQSEYSKYADFVIAQARHESADFKSKVYRENNNPFGMKLPSVRPTLAKQGTPAPKSEGGGFYARYDNDTEAFRDFLKWLRYTKFPTDLTTVEQYVKAMKDRKYFGATEASYLKAMKAWLARK